MLRDIGAVVVGLAAGLIGSVILAPLIWISHPLPEAFDATPLKPHPELMAEYFDLMPIGAAVLFVFVNISKFFIGGCIAGLITQKHVKTVIITVALLYIGGGYFDPADIGVIYDPQNMVKDGFETIQLSIELLGEYLAHVHIGAHAPSPGERDENATVQWNWSACPLSDGLYNMPKMFECLKNAGYDGFVSIEDFRGELTPEERLMEAREYLRKIVG